MGRLGSELADMAVVTSDNPRTEEPWSIMLEIEAGLAGPGRRKYGAGELTADDWKAGAYMMIMDRRAAIGEAVRLMNPGDVLIVAGKGHEDYQIIGREKRPLDDRAEALRALKEAGHDQ
jgi:UDP-N-acetylmuramoyl-L-alanyl-D-glutamate--2,6-diaminopimelate ligase